MIIHGIVAISISVSRCFLFRKHLQLKYFENFVFISLLTFGLCSYISYIPTKGSVYLILGLIGVFGSMSSKLSFLGYSNRAQISFMGFGTTAFTLIGGLSGPILDTSFLHSKLNRFEVLGTKSLVCLFAHSLKTLYFSTSGSEAETLFALPIVEWLQLVLAVLVGTYLGRQAVSLVSESVFHKATKGLLLCLSMFFLYRGMRHYIFI